MEGHFGSTIAALLRHSTTALVRPLCAVEFIAPEGRCGGCSEVWEGIWRMVGGYGWQWGVAVYNYDEVGNLLSDAR